MEPWESCRTHAALQTVIIVAATIFACTPLAVHHVVLVALAAQAPDAETTVRDAQSYFYLAAFLSLGVFNLLAGLSISTKHCLFQCCQKSCIEKMGCANDFDTKPLYFLGCLLGFVALGLQWGLDGYTAQLIVTVLFGAQQALCATSLLLVLMYRLGKHRAFAVGVYLACVYASELLGYYVGGLIVNDSADCAVKTFAGATIDLANATQTAHFAADLEGCRLAGEGAWRPLDCDCMRVHYLKETTAAAEVGTGDSRPPHCECDGFRPAGPIIAAIFLGLSQLAGFMYQDKNLAKKEIHDHRARALSSGKLDPDSPDASRAARAAVDRGCCSAQACAGDHRHGK